MIIGAAALVLLVEAFMLGVRAGDGRCCCSSLAFSISRYESAAQKWPPNWAAAAEAKCGCRCCCCCTSTLVPR